MVGRAVSIALAALFVTGPLFALAPSMAGAELSYSFSLDAEYVDIHIKKDGSIDIDYEMHFVNYKDLDGIDIGLPNRFYNLGSASASILVNGASYAPAGIEKSPYLPTGVAVNLGYSVRSLIENKYTGVPFTLKLHINNPHMVYENELKAGTVGIRFRPTWFSSTYQTGNTDVVVQKIWFPPGFTNLTGAVYLQNRPWNNITLDNGSGLVVATWSDRNVAPSSQEGGSYDCGAGFGAKYVDKYYKNDFWAQLEETFASIGDFLCLLWPCTLIATIFAVVIVWGYVQGRRRARDYFDPKLSTPGAGPRRDLTAVEASVVLERPMEMVATMILFGMLRKNIVEVIAEGPPLRLRAAGGAPEYPYETGYLEAITADGTLDRGVVRDAIIDLVEATQGKLKGFDFEATKTYYTTVCDRAWAEVQAAGTPEDLATGLEQNNDWMMLDRGYSTRMPMVYMGMPHHYHNAPLSKSSDNFAKGLSPAQMANSYVNRVKTTSSGLVTNMKGLASEVTKVTNPPPVSTAGRGGGGGGGGGCACACACACAGGGR